MPLTRNPQEPLLFPFSPMNAGQRDRNLIDFLVSQSARSLIIPDDNPLPKQSFPFVKLPPLPEPLSLLADVDTTKPLPKKTTPSVPLTLPGLGPSLLANFAEDVSSRDLFGDILENGESPFANDITAKRIAAEHQQSATRDLFTPHTEKSFHSPEGESLDQNNPLKVQEYLLRQLRNEKDDFIHHYYHGKGRDFDLIKSGYEDNLEAGIASHLENYIKATLLEIIRKESSKRKNWLGGFEVKIMRASQIAKGIEHPNLQKSIFSVGDTTLITNLDGILKVYPRNTLKEGRRYEFEGTRLHSIDDKFKDPLDLDEATRKWWPGTGDLPGSTPYSITAHWRRPYKVQGTDHQ